MSSEVFEVTEDGTTEAVIHDGGEMHVQLVGDFGSGTVDVNADYGYGATTLQSYTAADYEIFSLAAGCQVTFELSGATSPNLTIVVR